MSLKRLRTISLAIAIGALAPLSIPYPALADETAAEAALPERDTPMLRLNDKDYTLEDLRRVFSVRPVASERVIHPDGIRTLSGDDLVEFGRELTYQDLLAKSARDKDFVLSDEELESARNLARRYAQSILYDIVVTENLAEPTDEELEALYEELKQEMFTQEEELRLRHLFVSTYVPYRVKEGDTLESIAEEIGGDVALAERILSDATKRPRIEGIGDEEEDALEPRALTEGEALLVPVTGDKESTAREKIDAAYDALRAGRPFTEVAAEYSENENPGQMMVIRPKQQDRPIMEELLEAFMSVGDREFSEPIRTRHGFQIVYRERYRPESVTPREQAESQLKTAYDRRQRTQLVNEFFRACAMDEELTEVYGDVLFAPEGEIPPRTIALKIGEKTFTLEEASAMLRHRQRGANINTVEDVREKIAETLGLQGALVEAYSAQIGLFDDPRVAAAEEYARNGLLANNYLRVTAEELVPEVSEEDALAYYEENKARFTQPESYELYGAVVYTDDERDAASAKAYLEERVRGIQNVSDFGVLASELNPQGDRNFPSAGGAMGNRPVSRIIDDHLDAIRAVTPPGKTEVIGEDTRAVVYWVDAAQPETVTPFEEVKEPLTEQLLNMRRREKQNEIIADYKSQVRVELLL